MTDAAPGDVESIESAELADGRWHRLHPATPLLRGGIGLIAILGVVIANVRERILELFFGGPSEYEGDPIEWIVSQGLVGIALGVVAGVLVLAIFGFWLSWRMHSFRVGDGLVEVRSGILFRTNRRARLDRIQGVNIVRPFFARLFGAARLEINQAGDDANVQLSYLRSAQADALRRDILRLASGSAREQREAAASGDVISARISELLAPELPVDEAEPQSVVRLDVGRLAGSLALSEYAVIGAVALVGGGIWVAVSGEFALAFGFVPIVFAMGSVIVSRFTKSLRYSIAATPDGVRVGFGLLSTSNETLPPGRIHSVQVSQPLLWRPFGWWQIKVNRASRSSTRGAAGQENTTILPVGDLGDVARVLELLLPEVADRDAIVHALISRGDDPGFVNSPRRARPLRWFSRRRNGFAQFPGVVVLRKGAIWRQLVIVPSARVQSIQMRQGPLLRSYRLAELSVHTVTGPITPSLGALDVDQVMRAFDGMAGAAVAGAAVDRSHRWRDAAARAEVAASAMLETVESGRA